MSTLMDYKSTLLKYIFILLTITIISGCDTEVSPEPLRITGSPPDLLYFDSEFEYEFGAAGGDGTYRYRYIQNPDFEGDEELKENPVEMNIEVVDSAKASFILRSTPKLPDDITFEALNSQRHKYQIELTDGKNTVTRDFEFTLNKNKLKLINAGTIREGFVSSQPAVNLLAQLQAGNTRVCSSLKEIAFEKYLTPNGEYAYPYVIQVLADSQVASKTELFYRIKTNYNENDSENSKRNAAFARKDVDYLDAERSIVLEPGVISCVAYIDVLDDKILEGKESVSLEFYDRIGGALDYSATRADLEIVDDEIIPVYISENIVRNVGDKVIVPIFLSRPVEYPVTVNVAVDFENTTAEDNDYSLEPSTGVITFNPGEIQSAFSVSLLDGNSNTTRFIDKKITLTTDLDDLLDVDPFTIEINEWSDSVNIDSEIVGKEVNDENVVDFISDLDGVITTLIRSTANDNETTKLRSYNRNSSPYDFGANDIFEFSKIGVNVVAQAIVSSTIGTITTAAVIINVDGLFGDVFRGNTDFVIAIFQKESGGVFSLISVKQFGTEGDDVVSGARVLNDILYVYGKTNGLDLEGKPSFETNNGGEDGFLYALNLTNNSVIWARFIGTSAQDNIVSIDVGNKDIIAFVSTKNSDEDAFVRNLSTANGLDVEVDQLAEINTIGEDKPISIRFDATSSNYRVLLDSNADLNFVDKLTSSLTRDVQLIPYNSKNEKSTVLTFGTDQEDIAKSLENTPDNLNIILSGETFGELSGNIKKGTNDPDIFTVILGAEDSNSSSNSSTLQYGTPAIDSFITVKPISNTKFFVLWSEEYTNPTNKVYRISAFSIDGKKLSRDPE
jgi:hypothetical protein